MGTLLQDIRYGVRMLAKNPGFTAVAVLSLALGIGGNATVFSWLEAVLLHPLSLVQDSNRLVDVETVMPDGAYHTSSYPDFKDYRDHNHVFSGMIGFELVGTNLKLEKEQPPQRNWGLIVTENYFDLLGVNAARGRTFHAADEQGPNSDPYIVLSDGLWRRRFGSDPKVIGKSVEINQHPFTVIGIAPRGFNGTIVGIAAEYFVPMQMQPQALPGESLVYRNPTFIHMMGRLKPSVSLEQSRAEMVTIARQLEKQYPDTNRNVGAYVCPVWQAHYGLQAFLLPVLSFLMVVVILVLLIACANVANLLLARATVREKEIAIRSALGANRARLIRQLLAESLLLAGIGGAGGILLTLWTTNFLMVFTPPAHLPIGLPLGVDGRVLAFTLTLSVLTGVIFGLAPALQITRPSVNASLKDGGRTSSSGAGQHRLRNLLVVTETILAVVLLAGAGLLVRSLRMAVTSSPGFRADHVLLTALDLRGNGYSDDKAAAFFEQLTDRLKTVPGVEGATLERYVPMWFTGRSYTIPDLEGYTPKPGEQNLIDYNVVGPNYFSLMRIPILSGREFTAQDRLDTPRVCVINQTMAERFWPGQNPIGRRVGASQHQWTIAGVVKDIKYHSLNERPQPFLYFPFWQDTGGDANILVRTSGDPLKLLPQVREQVRALDSGVAILETDTVSELLSVSLFAYRTAATLAAVLGGLGLLLAAIGIYGVLSYSVSQRSHEIGIRMALGAAPRDVLGLVVGQGMRLTLLGVSLGLIAALATMHLLGSLLYGVTANDPVTFVVVMVTLSTVALVACYIPARRAMAVDPMVALRHE
ncbi:MAG: ABC transporter permease [Candidatus Acidiferrales bacterium]